MRENWLHPFDDRRIDAGGEGCDSDTWGTLPRYREVAVWQPYPRPRLLNALKENVHVMLGRCKPAASYTTAGRGEEIGMSIRGDPQ